MRKAILLIGIMLLSISSSAQWKKIKEFRFPNGQYMEAVTFIYFLDLPGPPRIGFVGTEPELWMTTDGAKSWSKSWVLDYSSGQYLNDICFRDSLTGWFTYNGIDGEVYRTDNGGASWYQQFASHFPVWGIHYCPVTNKIFLSSGDTLFVSSDLGNTWQSDLTLSVVYFSFSSDSSGIASAAVDNGNKSAILRTTNGGLTWLRSGLSLPDTIGYNKPLAIVGTPICFAASADRIRVFRSDDYGATWRLLDDFGPNMDSLFNDIGPYGTGQIGGDLSRLFIASDSGMYVSTDQGITWRLDGGPAGGVFWTGKGKTFAAMDNVGHGNPDFDGSLWEEDWPEAGVAESPCIDSSLVAISVSENPLHEVTTLRFELSDAEYVRVEVFDVLGYNTPCPSLQKTGEGLFEPGQHQIPIDFSRCASGTYYLRITLGTGEVRTIKLVKE